MVATIVEHDITVKASKLSSREVNIEIDKLIDISLDENLPQAVRDEAKTTATGYAKILMNRSVYND